MEPLVGRITPVIALIVVDLPAPLWPINPGAVFRGERDIVHNGFIAVLFGVVLYANQSDHLL